MQKSVGSELCVSLSLSLNCIFLYFKPY